MGALAATDAAAQQVPHVVLSPTALDVNEGGSASYTVKLSEEPSATVTVTITGYSGTDLTLDKSSLEFTTSTWDTAQTVTVTGGEDDDAVLDRITLKHTASGGFTTEAQLGVRILDNDSATLILSAPSLSVNEGGSASYTVKLNAEPTATVTVTITGFSGTDLTLDKSSLEFTTSTWDTAQTVTVTGGEDDDAVVDRITLVHTPSGGGFTTGAQLGVRVVDNDPKNLILSTTSLGVFEGGSASYTVKLSAEPTATVTVTITGFSGTDLTLDKSSLEFTTSAWNDAQTVTVTGGEDDDAVPDNITLVHTPSGGGFRTGAQLGVRIFDNDPKNLILSTTSLDVNEGGSASYTVKLSAEPTATVTVTITGFSGTDLTLDKSSLAFTTGTWDTAQTVTVTGGEDDDAVPDNITLTHTPSGGGFTSPARLGVRILDNDEPNQPPTVESSEVAFDLQENIDGSAQSFDLGALAAEDLDGDELSYELVSGGGARFALGERDGVLRYVGSGEDFESEETRYELVVRISDSYGGVVRVRIVVTVVNINEPPEAEDDEAATDEDGAVTVDVLANDTDPDGDRLRVESVSAPAHGTAAVASDGVRYTPDADYHGADRFTYVVSDGAGETATAAVAVTVRPVNDSPVFESSEYDFELRENVAGGRRPVDLGSVAAEDPDGDEPSYKLVSGAGSRFTVGERDGVVRYAGSGEDFESGPNQYELAVRARDPAGAAAEARVRVTVVDVNEPPEAEDDEAATDEDAAVTVDVLANDTDPDGDRLRVESVSVPAHGTAAVASDGVRYTPDADYHGADRFTYVVSDGNGETAEAAVAVTVRPVNDPPTAAGVIPDQALEEGGGEATVELTPFFEDLDGDALAYRAAVSDPSVAAAAVSGAVLTLAPVEYGDATVTVTAEDGGGLTATQTFAVGVGDRLVRGVVRDTLAGMARSHLASARMTLGRRVTAGRKKASRVTVLGRAVPLGRAGRAAGEQTLAGWLSSWAAPHGGLGGAPMGPGLGAGLGGRAKGTGAMGAVPASAAAPGGVDAAGYGGSGGLGSFAGFPNPVDFGGGADPLRGSEFLLSLGGGSDAGEGGAPGRRWQVWGQGDVQAFKGAPSEAVGYDGGLRTAYVGVDTWVTARWLAGAAVARSRGRADWRTGGSQGSLATALTAVHPYVRWSDGATSVWATAGAGRGLAENVRRSGRAGAGGLGLRLGLVELRRRLGRSAGGVEFGLRADAGWAELRTAAGAESIDGQTAAVNQARVGAEASRRVRLRGLSVAPFGEAHVRHDGGAGETGAGVEVAAGLRAAAGRLRVDARGRMLAVHSASGYRERGAGLTLSVGDRGREGLSLSVSPRWGDPVSGGGALWQEQVYRHHRRAGPGRDAWELDARGGYGTRLRSGRLLTWFGSLSHSALGRRFLVGGRIGVLD